VVLALDHADHLRRARRDLFADQIVSGALRPLRIGVAGVGFGGAVHLPAFAALPGVSIVAAAATRLEKARAAAEPYGATACIDAASFFACGMDAVALVLPPAANAAWAAEALARGLPILCEKPVAADEDAALLLAASAQAAGVPAGVDFTFVELSGFRRLRDALADETWGPVRAAHLTWLTESWAHRAGSWGWKVDADAGGGVMTHQGSHALFLAEWLLGPLRPVAAAYDRRATAAFAPPGARPAEDGAALTLIARSGALATMALSNAAPGGDGLHRWEIVCARGTLILERRGSGVMDGFVLSVRDGSGGSVVLDAAPEGGAAGGRLEPFSRLAERFVTAVRTGGGFYPDIAAGARAQTLTAQCARLAGA
jgi:predicted dehydrogenase